MNRRAVLAAIAVACLLPAAGAAQMTYRMKGTVRDGDGKPVTEATVRAEALVGYRGQEFAGQKEFDVKTNARGEWVILGITSGIWAFEVSAPDLIPQVMVLPVNFTNRQPLSAKGGSFSWDLPFQIRRATNPDLTAAAAATTAHRPEAAIAGIGAASADPNPDVLCSAGGLALLLREKGLARAVFDLAIKRDAKHPCATLGLASAALMQNDYDRGTKMLWDAWELAPKDLKPALGAAVKDMQGISVVNPK